MLVRKPDAYQGIWAGIEDGLDRIELSHLRNCVAKHPLVASTISDFELVSSPLLGE